MAIFSLSKATNDPPYAPWLVFAVFFSIPLGFALYTNHAWEDWYITFRASKNLALGNGLVFQPGERLHTFTSPLGTLIPALLAWVTGGHSDDLVLWLFRLFNCILLGSTGVLTWSIGRSIHRHRFATFILLLYLAIDPKLVDNSIDGMETAIMAFFLTLTIYALVAKQGTAQLATLTIALAGVMWTRPDGFVYVSGLLLGALIWPGQSSLGQSRPGQLQPARTRADWFRLLVKAGALAALLYLPWLLWATWYYGTPVPNTVLAKSMGSSRSAIDVLQSVLLFPINTFRGQGKMHLIFTPTYLEFGGWPFFLYTISKILTTLAIFYWLVPKAAGWGKIFSLTAFISVLYLSTINYPYPWYIPMGTFFCIYALSMLLDQVLTWVRTNALLSTGVRGLTAGLAVVQLGVFLVMANEMRLQQSIIETNHRKEIGLWLKANAQPGQTVFMECLGYIGFYSGMKTLDYPGLSSGEVIAARKLFPATVKKGYPDEFGPLIVALKPDFVVLRDHEIANINQHTTVLQQDYTPVKVFDVTPQLASHERLPGYGYLRYDARFTVFAHTGQEVARLEAREKR